MWHYTQFRMSSGQALFVVGALDMMLAISATCESYAMHFYKLGLERGRPPITEFSHHLDYPAWALLGMENCKLCWSLMLWIGGLILGKHPFLQAWIWLSIITEVVLQLLVWISEYHHHILSTASSSSSSSGDTSPTALVLRLTYAALIRIFVRTCLLLCVIHFLRKNSSTFGNTVGVATTPTTITPQTGTTTTTTSTQGESSSSSFLPSLPGPSSLPPLLPLPPIILSQLKVPQDVDLLPVGSGPLNILRFYYGDIARLTKLLLTIDFVSNLPKYSRLWGLIRLLEREGSQILFGQGSMGAYVLSSVSTPVFVEERIIRLFRLGFDAIFLTNLHNDKPPLASPLILPKIIELLVSGGILVFIRLVDFASPLFTLFYIFFILDLLFRGVTFTLCYRAYGQFLCRSHRSAVTAVANKNLKKINSVVEGL